MAGLPIVIKYVLTAIVGMNYRTKRSYTSRSFYFSFKLCRIFSL